MHVISGGGTTGAAAAAAASAVGPLPQLSLSSHSRGSLLFSQMTARVCGGVPSPLIEPLAGQERKGPT